MDTVEAVDEAMQCPNCGYELRDCRCTCPYCGETDACTCCVGWGRALGGG